MYGYRVSPLHRARGPALAAILAILLYSGLADGGETPPGEFEGDVEPTVEHTDRLAEYERDRLTVRDVYDRHGDRLLWVDDRKVTSQGGRLLQVLRDAEAFGLRPDDYDAAGLLRQLARLHIDKEANVAQWAEFDAAVTIAATRFVRHLHSGRVDPRRVGFYATSSRTPVDVPGLVRALAAADSIEPVLAVIEPPHPQYRQLKDWLQRYRMLAQVTPADLPDFEGRSVKVGDHYTGMPKVRRLLAALGDLPVSAGSASDVLHDADATAILRFQRRHGLEADGALGQRTLAALRTPLTARVRQIELSLERWRWLPDFDSPPILVNVPQFRLFAFRSLDEPLARARQMDVIVGKDDPTSQTPIFAGDLKYIVFRPYWEVPQTIADEEILPATRRDVRYLWANDMEVVTHGNTPYRLFPTAKVLDMLAAGKVRVRQRPGPNNSLGLVKLMMPNPYNVYLHGTPAQHLFSKSRRAFSHGCIRVSDPAGLVEHVLQGQLENQEPWTREKIEAAMQDGRRGAENRHVFLRTPVPVLFVYGTAMADAGDTVLFFEDIYGHDAKLEQLLAER